ncbi:MAG TPA: 30S ribosomal protein S6, partial [bacterium]|nr:30S ribosomal protein S6 [bacterium]
MSNLLKYDVIYILDPNATSEDAAAVATKVEQITADAKGTILKKDDWGKRRLAYLVQKHREGHYIFYHLSLSTDAVAEIQRNLRLMEKVIKFSIVKDTISHLKAKV